MSQSKSLTPARWLCLATFCLIVPATAFAQSSKTTEAVSSNDNAIIRVLLDEVHLLRLALEQKNTTSSRLQVLVERVRLQQEMVSRQIKDLDEVRNKLVELKISQLRTTDAIKELEAQFRSESFPIRRAELDKQIKALKAEQEPFQQRQQRLQEQETQMASQLQIEQAKLRDLNDRLDALEQEFDPLPSKKK